MLSDAQLNHYHDHGFVVPDFRIPNDVMDAIDTHTAALIDAHPEFRDNCSALLREDMSFAQYCEVPGLLDMVTQVIGPDIALWNMSLFGKPAHNGKATPWHQDGEYWPIRPLATCTVWIAIDDSNEENGCLRVIRGSHRAQQLAKHRHNPSEDFTLFEELLDSEFNEADAVDIHLERGQVSLHDVYLMHGSAPNRSAHRRRGMTMRLMPTTSVYDRNVANEMFERRGGRINLAHHPVLLLRGADRTGRNEFHPNHTEGSV
ncbi:MAG: phytanoyl-CoA dioxygenase family protein [Pseudomonadota bacterium]